MPMPFGHCHLDPCYLASGWNLTLGAAFDGGEDFVRVRGPCEGLWRLAYDILRSRGYAVAG
jgi:hypothetical protein